MVSLVSLVMSVYSLLSPTHKFGILEPGKIYRSAELGARGLRSIQAITGPLKTVIYMNAEGYAFPFYFALGEYKQSLRDGIEFYHSFGSPRTYLDGEDPYHPTDMIDTPFFLGHRARHYFSYGDGYVTGGIDNLVFILDLILDPSKQPVLFHCFGGIHRTGMVAMLVRIIQGWNLDEAVNEYHQFNPYLPRQKNIRFVERFISDPRFLEIKNKYQR